MSRAQRETHGRPHGSRRGHTDRCHMVQTSTHVGIQLIVRESLELLLGHRLDPAREGCILLFEFALPFASVCAASEGTGAAASAR